MSIKFEIGKAYEHNSGIQMFICGQVDSIMYGKCLIGEKGWNRDKLALRTQSAIENGEKMPSGGFEFDRGHFTPVSDQEWATVNYFEISKEEFEKNNYEFPVETSSN